MTTLSFHYYTDADYTAFAQYIRESFHEKYILSDERYIKWQYANTLLLAREGTEIIGHFGFRDIGYQWHGRAIPTRILMNLFVKEKYRMTGVATLLSQKVFDTHHPILVSGYTPKAASLFSHLRPQWHHAGMLRRFFIVLNPSASLFAGFTLPHLAPHPGCFKDEDITITQTLPSAEFIDACWERVKNRYGITPERTSSYITWRFINHPFFSYTFLTAQHSGMPSGYIIIKIEEDEGFRIARIIDMAATKETQCALLQECIVYAKNKSACAVDFLLSGAIYDSALVSTGFFDSAATDFERFPILFNPISFKKAAINIGYDVPAPFEDCFLTKADGDQDRPNPH